MMPLRRSFFWLLPVLAFLAGRGAGAWWRPAEGGAAKAQTHNAPRPPAPLSAGRSAKKKHAAAAFDASTPLGRWALALRDAGVAELPDRWADLVVLGAEGLERRQYEAARRLLVEKWMRLDWRGACDFFGGLSAQGGPEAAGLILEEFAAVMGRLHPQEAETLWREGFGPSLTTSQRFRDALLGGLAVSAPERFLALGLSPEKKMEVSRGFFAALDDVIDSDPARAAAAWQSWKGGGDTDTGVGFTGSRAHPSNDVRFLARLAKTWSTEDPGAARAWIASLSGARAKALAWNQYFIAQGEADPRAAWAEMQKWSLEDQALADSAGIGLSRLGLRDSAQAKVLAALAKDDPVEATRLLEAYVRTQKATAVPEKEPSSPKRETIDGQRRFFLTTRILGDPVSLTEQGIQQAANTLRKAIMEGFASGLPEAPADVARRLAAMDYDALAAPGQEPAMWQHAAMAAWLQGRDSGQAALFWEEAKKLPQSRTLGPAMDSALAAVLRADTARGLELFQSRPSGWYSLDTWAVLEQAQPRSPQEVRELLAVMQPDFLGETFVRTASQQDPATVADWVAEMESDHARTSAVLELAGVWGKIDPQAATAWIAAHPEDALVAVTPLTASWLRYEADAASRWIADLPASPVRDAAVATLIGYLSTNDPEAAWAWASSIPSEERRRSQVAFVAERWARQDEPAARAAIEAAGYTPEELGVNPPKTP